MPEGCLSFTKFLCNNQRFVLEDLLSSFKMCRTCVFGKNSISENPHHNCSIFRTIAIDDLPGAHSVSCPFVGQIAVACMKEQTTLVPKNSIHSFFSRRRQKSLVRALSCQILWHDVCPSIRNGAVAFGRNSPFRKTLLTFAFFSVTESLEARKRVRSFFLAFTFAPIT